MSMYSDSPCLTERSRGLIAILQQNNTPVFFLRDPSRFSTFIHTQKRDPQTHLKSADMFWDYLWVGEPHHSESRPGIDSFLSTGLRVRRRSTRYAVSTVRAIYCWCTC